MFAWLFRLSRSTPRLLRRRGVWLEDGQGVTQEDLHREYIKSMATAQHTYQLVTGDIAPTVLNREEVTDILSTLVESRKGRVQIVYQGPDQVVAKASDDRDLQEDVRSRNPRLATLAEKYPGKVSIYRAKSVLRQHYAITDGKHVLLQEREHAPSGPKYVYIRNDDVGMAQEWDRRFRKLLDDTWPVKFDGHTN